MSPRRKRKKQGDDAEDTAVDLLSEKEGKKQGDGAEDTAVSLLSEEDLPAESVGFPLSRLRPLVKTELIKIPPPHTWLTRAGWNFPRNARSLEVMIHAKLTLRSPGSVMRWRQENPWSSLGAGAEIPGRSLLLGSFSFVQSAGSWLIHGTWADLYVKSSVAYSTEESTSDSRHLLRLMPKVDHWRGPDGLPVECVLKGCEAEVRLKFKFNGQSFDPNNVGGNAPDVARDYNFYWWRPERERVTTAWLDY